MFTNLDSFMPSYNEEIIKAFDEDNNCKFRDPRRFKMPKDFKKKAKVRSKMAKSSKRRNRNF